MTWTLSMAANVTLAALLLSVAVPVISLALRATELARGSVISGRTAASRRIRQCD